MSDSAAQPFPVTRWSLIARARGGGDPLTRQALDELVRRYSPALRTHLLLSRNLAPDRADDVLQGFLASRVVEQRLLGNVGPEKGRFRTFLLRAMNNYLIDQLRAERAQKRGGGGASAATVSRSIDDLESDRAHPPDDAPGPAEAFDLAWARQVIDEAAEILRAQYTREDRVDMWETFRGRVLAPALEGAEPTPYSVLIEQFGYASPEQASNVLVTARRAFQRALRQVVADYCDESEVDDEIRTLQAVAAREGRQPR